MPWHARDSSYNVQLFACLNDPFCPCPTRAHCVSPPPPLPLPLLPLLRPSVQVGHKLGQAIDQETAHNMMQLAASQVLGWGSGAGRSQGARGALSLAEFQRLVDHFRV